MSVNLIRKNSDTPNIRNYDDARLFRYINQGKSGIIKDYGDELAMTHGTGNNLHIASGEIIHQGWQVEITAAGIDIELENRDSVEYYSVYLEINLSISTQQKAEIKYLKGNEAYPVIDAGDDLTTTPTGTSRLLIAKVYLVPSSSTFTIDRQISVIPYYPTYALEAEYASSDHSKGTIEQRLTDLGFKSGSLTVSVSGATATSPTNSLVKQGQMVRCMLNTNITESNANFSFIATAPSQFRPIIAQRITIEVVVDAQIYMEASGGEITPTAFVNYNNLSIFKEAYINVGGSISVSRSEISTILTNMYSTNTGDFTVRVNSFSIKSISIYTGWKLN